MRRLNQSVLGCAVGVTLTCCSGVWAQSEDGSKSVKVYPRSGAVAARAPGLWVRDALGPLEITATADMPPTRQQQILIDSITSLFLALNTIIPLLPSAIGDGPGGGIGQLVLTEIANDGSNTFVEVFNPSGIRIELDNWALCKTDGCTAVSELAGRVMEGGDILVFQLGGQLNSSLANGVVTLQTGTTADDIGLYDFTGADRDPLDSAPMRDYLQWGTFIQSFGLEDVAISAGLWASQSSIDSSLGNQSFQLRADRFSIGGNSGDYIVVPFADHSLGAVSPADLESSTAPAARLR